MSTRRWVFPLVLLVAIVAAYWRSFSGVFVFDDIEAIVENPTIRHLSDLGAVLKPPYEAGQTVGGRPLVNLSLALNYVAGGLNPFGYHLFNLAIHAGAALALMGVLRRVFQVGTPLAATARAATSAAPTLPDPDLIAFGATLIWALHPLQTESVTYVIQRAESLMGLFYLLTVYCFIRAVHLEGPAPSGSVRTPPRASLHWKVLSVCVCFFGMATKEVMASAPVIVLIFDRVFVSGSLGEALRRRKGYYAGLASSWLLLGGLVLSTHNRGGSMGVGLNDVTWWEYVLTQFPAIAHYLRLAVWPAPLIFDYGAEWVQNPWSVAPAAVLVLALAVASVVGALRGKWWGFLGLFFFAILAPTSLVPANRQTISEHRMYLALAPIAVLGSLAVAKAAQAFHLRKADGGQVGRKAGAWRVSLLFLGAIAVSFGALTAKRQAVYRSEIALWSDTVAKRPLNPHAHGNLGKALALAGNLAQAKPELMRALELRNDLPDAHGNLANILSAEGDEAGALVHYETAVQLRPQSAVVHSNLAGAYIAARRVDDGIAQYREAIRLDPGYERAHYNLGNALATLRPQGKASLEEAAVEFGAVLRLQPESDNARVNLIIALAQLSRFDDAIAQAAEGARVRPDSAEIHSLLGALYAQTGKTTEARAEFEHAVRLDPTYEPARNGLARLNSVQGPGRPQ